MGLLALASSCARQAEAGRDLEPIASAAPGTASTGQVTAETPAPETTIAPALVDNCVGYVPFAAYTGNFYMQIIWDQANRDVAQLRELCEQIGRDDPEGLSRISTEHQAVEKYLAAASKGTVVPANCAPGSVLGDEGFCVADR